VRTLVSALCTANHISHKCTCVTFAKSFLKSHRTKLHSDPVPGFAARRRVQDLTARIRTLTGIDQPCVLSPLSPCSQLLTNSFNLRYVSLLTSYIYIDNIIQQEVCGRRAHSPLLCSSLRLLTMFDDSDSGGGLSSEINDHDSASEDNAENSESDEDALARALHVPPPSADIHELRKVSRFRYINPPI